MDKYDQDSIWIRKFLMPILIGIVFGILILGIPLLVNVQLFLEYWHVFYRYDYFRFLISQIQTAICFIIGSVTIGYCLTQILGDQSMRKRDVFVAGTISGTCSGLLFTGMHYLTFQTTREFLIAVHYPTLYVAALIFISSIIFQVTGALIGYLLIHHPRKSVPHSSQSVPIHHGILRPSVVAAILIALVIAIPPLIVGSASLPNDPERMLCYQYLDNYVQVDRLNEDTIRIAFRTECEMPDNSQTSFLGNKIFVDNQDISNLSVARQQGIPVDIDPPEGLAFVNGSQVTIRGPAVSNATHRPYLKIREYFLDLNGTWMPSITYFDWYICDSLGCRT